MYTPTCCVDVDDEDVSLILLLLALALSSFLREAAVAASELLATDMPAPEFGRGAADDIITVVVCFCGCCCVELTAEVAKWG